MAKPVWLVLFAIVFAIAIWIRMANPAPPVESWDEQFYIHYTSEILDAPRDAPRDFVARYNATPGVWTYPIPLRIGYFYAVAAIAAVCHVTPAQAGIALSTAASILQLAMLAILGLRFFNRWTVLIALALLAVSPQDLAMARRTWVDGVSGCVAMIILWLCVEISIRPRAAKLWFAALWICSFWFLLLKETGAVFFGLCILGLGIQRWRQHRTWKPVITIFAGAACAAICSFVVMTLLCGGVSAALLTVRHNAQAAPGNSYGMTFQSGPWYSFPIGLWVLSPFAALLLPGGKLCTTLSMTAEQHNILTGLAGLTILVIIAATLPPALKNLRYISFIFAPIYLMAAVGLTYALTCLRNIVGLRARPAVTGCAALLLVYFSWSDYSLYRDICIDHPLLDLDIRQLVGSRFGEAPFGKHVDLPVVNLDLSSRIQDKATP